MKTPLINRVIRALRRRALSIRELAEQTASDQRSVGRIIHTLKDAEAIHIARYRIVPPATVHEAVFAWGEGSDAPAPGHRMPARQMRPPEPPPVVRYGFWGL